MKQVLSYIFAFSVILSGCNKDTDLLFDKSADERITETLNNYQSALSQAPGWKLFVYPAGLQSQDIEVGGLTYYVKFTADNRVTMVSDFVITMADVPKASGYRLKATQRPSLIFDTYSYIHVAADPDPDVSFSPTQQGGFGWGTDFDFSFTDVTPKDTIKLKGNFNNSDAVLIKATQAEIDAAFGGRLGDIMTFTSDFVTSTPFLSFPASDNSRIGVSLNFFLYIINFSYLTSGSLVTVSAPFSHTTYGLHFKEPVSVGGYVFQDLYWDDVAKLYYIKVGSGRVNITGSTTPLFPLHVVLGKSITTISVPTTPLAGQSPLFTTRYATVKANLKTSGYNLDLGVMDFIFDDASKLMAWNTAVTQNGIPFVIQYVYSYTLSGSGIAKFTRVSSNGNGALPIVEASMAPIMSFIDNDQFKMDYFTGSSPILGQFISQQNSTFFFTGNLQ
ncbi:MAG TPA: DUF4302 domain-containing protein [Flavitalea sp.]|nr:DUF4302 domain-containing protein [Flavitalea sp.]